MKDYCSCFPEFVGDVYIGDCCKQHDNDSGQAGDYRFDQHALRFYKCLYGKIGKFRAALIALGGTILVIIKLPWLIYKKVRYAKRLKT